MNPVRLGESPRVVAGRRGVGRQWSFNIFDAGSDDSRNHNRGGIRSRLAR